MFETLVKLGLSEKEAKVYLAALELGQDTVQNIAEKSKVNRATTYVILEKLMKLGLVSTHEESKKTVFVAEDPHELVNILEEQKRKIDAKKDYLDASLNQLMAIYNGNAEKPTVRYYEGPDGLEALDRYGFDQFKPNSEMLSLMPIDIIEKQFGGRRRKSVSDRVARGIRSRVIYTHEGGPLPESVNDQQLRDAVFLSRDQLPIDGTVSIHPNWGIKLYYFDADQPYGVLIQSPALANNMRQLFELAWLGAKQKQQN